MTKRFALSMLAFAALLTILWQLAPLASLASLDYASETFALITEWNARLVAALLELQGIDVLRRGSSLHHASGFSCKIDLACTGLPILALIVPAIILYPTTTRLRLRALALALPLFLALNLIRMVHLVRVGIEAPLSFDFAHDVAWRVALILLLAAGWSFWRHLAIRERAPSG